MITENVTCESPVTYAIFLKFFQMDWSKNVQNHINANT